MANLRDIRNRIKSVKSTEKITRAMKMVAAAKLRRAQESASGATPYQEKIEALLSSLAPSAKETVHPFLSRRQHNKRLIVVFSSDRGLCGGFNNNLFKRMVRDLEGQQDQVDLYTIGKKAKGFFSNKSWNVQHANEDFWTNFGQDMYYKEVFDHIATTYLEGAYGKVEIYFNHFHSVMNQEPTLKTLLPLAPEASEESTNTEYTFKPSSEAILKRLVPRAVLSMFYHAALQSLAGEYGARMTSMDSASRNAGEMIDSLTLKMNRVRQAAITNELVEIISGAEAIS